MTAHVNQHLPSHNRHFTIGEAQLPTSATDMNAE